MGTSVNCCKRAMLRAVFVLLLGFFVLCAIRASADEGTDEDSTVSDDDFAEFDEEEFVNEPTTDQAKGKPTDRTTGRSEAGTERTQVETSSEPVSDTAGLEDVDDADLNVEVEPDAFVESEQYDPNEFEGYEDDLLRRGANSPSQGQKPPELKIAEVPMVLGRNWEHYYVEYLLVCGLLFYLIWYASGKTTNSKLASAWLDTHLDLLTQHFALVGDEGTSKDVTTTTAASEQDGIVNKEGEEAAQKPLKFIKEAEHIYTLWCSGRSYVEGLLVTLRLKKRQDMLTSLWRIFRPSQDQVCVRFYMEKDEMDSFVLCVSKKASIPRLQKDMAELNAFCPDRKPGDRFNLPSSFSVLSEIGESVSAVLDTKVLAVIEKYEQEIEYLFFSDQYNPKPEENQQQSAAQARRPEPMRILQFCFNLPKNINNPVEAMEHMQPLLLVSLYLADKVHRYKLQREAKAKAEKNRQKIQEEYLKSTHAQRQEAAQLRREEKRRVEKEKILSEEDPEKQRKLEEREHRREMKKRGPKVKAVKVKAM